MNKQKLETAISCLNLYRNQHYSEPSGTPEYELAQAINEVLPLISRAHLPDNKALTVDELRELIGEPVWVVSPLASVGTGWRLVGKDYDGTVALFGRNNVVYEYGMQNCRIAVYRHTPEKGA